LVRVVFGVGLFEDAGGGAGCVEGEEVVDDLFVVVVVSFSTML
jgi:hypothetical protein